MQTRIISVVNQKGGVGKTTTVATLGSLLASSGKKVLMVDLDAQCNLTDSFLEQSPEKSLYNSFIGEKGDFTVQVRDNLYLLPSSLDMSAMDLMISGRMEREKILARILWELNQRNAYDIILLDCPPSLGILIVNAIVASTDIYVTTTAEYLPLKGLVMLSGICDTVAQGLNPGIGITGIIVTRYNSTKKLNVSVDAKLRETYGDLVFDTRIRENVKLAECPMSLKDITTYAPESNGAKDYMALCEEIKNRLTL